jgi:GNAT superfamily N-acetyltransferase
VLPVVVEQVRPEITYDLRARVLRPGLPPLEARFRGDSEPSALHFAAYDRADRIVGVAAVVPEPMPPDDEPGRRLRGMAVHPDERGQGVGHALLARVIDGVARLGGGLLWCNARLAAAGFYERGGFVRAGERWEDTVLGPHIRMRRTVTDDDLIAARHLDWT